MLRQYPIKIYTTFKNQIPKMFFVQHDTKVNKITFELYDNNKVSMKNIVEATGTVKRPDGNTYTYGNDCFEIKDNLVTFILPPSAVYTPGKCSASISVYDTDYGRLTTQTFTYDVTADLIADTPIDETNEYPVLTKLINDTQEIKDDIAVAEAVRTASETARVNAENVRVEEFNDIKTDYSTYKNVMIAESNVAALQNQINSTNATLNDMTKYEDARKFVTKTLAKLIYGTSIKIVCAGDSETYGHKPTVGGQVANPYPLVLQTKLRQIYKNNNITVLNKGYDNYTSRTYLANHFQSDVLDQAPDLCIMMLGINDNRGSLGDPVPPDEYRENMKTMVKQMVKNNIEVILMSPSFAIELALEKSLRIYAKILEEIAVEYNCGFVDIYSEVNKLISVGQETPMSLFPDLIHFEDTKYVYIADFILGNALYYNNKFKINDMKNGEINIVTPYSYYIETNCPEIYSSNGLNFYVMKLSVTSHLNLNFYNDIGGADLYLNCVKSAQGAIATVTIDGISKTVDFYSPESALVESNEILIKNLSIGFHTIEILNTNITHGQGSLDSIFISGFKLKTNKDKVTNIYNISGSTLAKLEQFKQISNGTIRLNSPTTDQNGVMFFEEYANLQTGKTLVIEVEGKVFSGFGFTFFGNKAKDILGGTNLSNANNGYMIYVTGTPLNYYLLYFNQDNNFSALTSNAISSSDYTISHKIRVEITTTGSISVYIDGVKKIDSFIDTKNKSGYFGLYSNAVGNAEITRFEYCYI